jgi:8-amino-7-oxononanoate synthase
VPKGTKRVRLVFHADHTDAQVDSLAAAICEWAHEMMEIEASDKSGSTIPCAAQQVFALQSGAREVTVS